MSYVSEAQNISLDEFIKAIKSSKFYTKKSDSNEIKTPVKKVLNFVSFNNSEYEELCTQDCNYIITPLNNSLIFSLYLLFYPNSLLNTLTEINNEIEKFQLKLISDYYHYKFYTVRNYGSYGLIKENLPEMINGNIDGNEFILRYISDYLNVNIWIINSDMTVEFAGCYLENYMIYTNVHFVLFKKDDRYYPIIGEKTVRYFMYKDDIIQNLMNYENKKDIFGKKINVLPYENYTEEKIILKKIGDYKIEELRNIAKQLKLSFNTKILKKDLYELIKQTLNN